MATSIHVNGPAVISVGSGGTGGGLSTLGIAENGVDIDIEFKEGDVHADSGGGLEGVPVDVRDLGEIGYIKFKLTVYDQTVLDSLIIRTSAAAGQEPSPGKLFGANSKFKRIVILSPDEGLPYRFFYCHITGRLLLQRGTKETQPDVNLRALPGTGTTATMATLPLYDNTAA